MTLTDLSDSRVMDGILYSYEYDELNRRSKETAHYIPGNTLTKTYSYSPLGAVSGMSLSGNEGVFNHDYHYDPRGRLSAATLPGNQNINLQLNNDGTPSAITHGNNIITNINYNANGLIKTIATNGSNSAQPLAVQLSYQHDAENNIRTITSEQGNHTFYYDRLNRLTGAQYPPLSGVTNNDGEERPLEENFEYDYGHNLSKDDGNDWVFDKNHRITEKGDLRYHYDPDGNLTSKTTLGLVPIESHSYDTDGRRIGFQKDNTTANYQYDPLGRRISKTVEVSEGTATHTTQTWYLWHNEKLLAEYHSNGAMQKRYAYLPGRYLPEQMEDANGLYTIHGDHLETPKAMTDVSGNVVWKMHNTAYGDAWIEDDLDEDGNAVTLNIRFPGQYFDWETGLHYNYFRDYAPGLGRYVQSDPIGLAGGLNTYGYVGANPLSFTDPLGLFRGCRLVSGGPGFDDYYVCSDGGPDYNDGSASAFDSGNNLTPEQCENTPVSCKEKLDVCINNSFLTNLSTAGVAGAVCIGGAIYFTGGTMALSCAVLGETAGFATETTVVKACTRAYQVCVAQE